MSAKQKQFWVIDTETPGLSQGQFSATGPFPSRRSAESHIINDTRELWEDSGTSAQTETTRPWCKPLHIVEVVRTVVPAIKAQIKLEDVTP